MGFVGVAPGTTTLTLPDGSVIALADWIDDKLYGSLELENGQTESIEAFSNGRSQPIPGGTRPQTRVDTNIPRNGDSGLPKDWEMLVYGWGIKLSRAFGGADAGVTRTLGAQSDPVTLATMFDIDRKVYFEYQYNSKAYTNGVMEDYPQGHGYTVFSTNAAFEVAQNGVPSPRDRVALVLPVHERENLGYKGVFQPEAQLAIAQPSSVSGTHSLVDLKLYKYGLIKRTVI